MLLDYTKRRLSAFIEEIDRLRDSEFPYEHSKDALEELRRIFQDRLEQINYLSGESDKAIVVQHCSLALRDFFGSPKVRVGHFASLTLGGGSSMSVPQRHDHPDERGRRVTPKSENSAPSVQAGKSRMCTVSHLSIVI